MFISYERSILFVIILFALIGCAGFDPYKSYYDDVNRYKQINIAASKFRLTEQEFLNAIKLAEQGNAKAQYIVGYSYWIGYPAADSFKAGYWLRKSAEQGYTDAQATLAQLYRFGIGVPHDPSQELFWYTKAAENGSVGAQYALGYKYFYGVGVPRDSDHGLWWMRKSADSGSRPAQNFLQEQQLIGEQRLQNKLGFEGAMQN